MECEWLLKFIKLNYNLINFQCLQHRHHHRHLIWFTSRFFCGLCTVPWTCLPSHRMTFPPRRKTGGNSIWASFHPEGRLIDNKLLRFSIRPRLQTSARHSHHTRTELLFRDTQHNLSADVYALWCSSCNSTLIHFMLFSLLNAIHFRKDLFMLSKRTMQMEVRMRRGVVAQHNKN